MKHDDVVLVPSSCALSVINNGDSHPRTPCDEIRRLSLAHTAARECWKRGAIHPSSVRESLRRAQVVDGSWTAIVRGTEARARERKVRRAYFDVHSIHILSTHKGYRYCAQVNKYTSLIKELMWCWLDAIKMCADSMWCWLGEDVRSHWYAFTGLFMCHHR